MNSRRIFMKTAAVAAAVSLSFGLHAAESGTIKIGVLHSLSGTMAISETTLKDTMLMLIDEQNKKGGVLGKKLEAVVVDPKSDWPTFAQMAEQLRGLLGEQRPVRSRVDDDRLELLAEQPALLVLVLDHHQDRVFERRFADGHRARQRVQDADLDRGLRLHGFRKNEHGCGQQQCR